MTELFETSFVIDSLLSSKHEIIFTQTNNNSRILLKIKVSCATDVQ